MLIRVLRCRRFSFVFCVLAQLAFCLFITAIASAQPIGNPLSGSGLSEMGIGGVLISPTNYRVNVSAGQRSSLEFVTANPGRTRSSARLEIQSYLPEEWTYVAREGGAHARDAAVWFSDRDLAVEYAPGLRKVTKFKYAVPRGTAPGSYWCMLKFSPRPEGSSGRSKIIVQIPIMFTVGRGKPVIQVSSPLLDSGANALVGTNMLVKLPLENAGAFLAIVGANGAVRDLTTGRSVAELKVEDNNLMPGTKRHLTFSVPRLPDGRYKITLKAELGSRLLPAVTSEYTVIQGIPQIATEATTMQLVPISVEPDGFTVSAPAGSARQQALRLTNLSNRAITVDIGAQAVEQLASGSIGLSEASLPEGMTITVSPQTITLRPRSAGTTRVTVRFDRDASGEKWFGLALTERGNAQALSETVLSSASVTGTLQPMLEVINPKMQFVGNQPVAVAFAVKNTGNQALQLLPRAVVLSGGVKMVARLEVPVQSSGGILPGVELPNLVQLPPDLAPGDYIVEIIYSYTEDADARLRVPLVVKGSKIPESPPAKTPAATTKAKTPSAPKKPIAPTKKPALPPKSQQ